MSADADTERGPRARGAIAVSATVLSRCEIATRSPIDDACNEGVRFVLETPPAATAAPDPGSQAPRDAVLQVYF